MTTAVSIFDVNGTEEEVKLVSDALAMLLPSVKLWLEGVLPRHEVNFVDDIAPTSAGIHPEALYPGGNKVKMRRLTDANGNLMINRLQGNFIHELGHGLDRYVIGAGKESQLLKLFDPIPTKWNMPADTPAEYWKQPYESFCDWWVRVATDNKLISHWEYKRRIIPTFNRSKILPILMAKPETPTATPPASDPNGEDDQEMPLTNVVELQRGSIALGVPILHPVTKTVMFKSQGNPSAKLVGVTADGLHRGVLVMTKQIPGTGFKTALVASNQVTNIRVEDPSVALKEENEQLKVELTAAQTDLDTAQTQLAHANDVAAADLADAQEIVTRHS